MTTLAGTSSPGIVDGNGFAAQFQSITGLAHGGTNVLFALDSHCVRKILVQEIQQDSK